MPRAFLNHPRRVWSAHDLQEKDTGWTRLEFVVTTGDWSLLHFLPALQQGKGQTKLPKIFSYRSGWKNVSVYHQLRRKTQLTLL